VGAGALAPRLGVSRLEIARLSFGYHGRAVGRDVSFALEGGEVVCLLGPNGGGKTTLFKTILGLLPALGGTIAIDGEPVGGWTRARLARVLGYVPQAQLGVFPFSVREVVLMGRTAHIGPFATPSRRDVAIADATLETLGVAHLADRPYTEVSGGERQMTLVARALAQEPRVLVMDEPTASLDFGNQVRVLAHVRDLAGRGMAVILSTHDPDQAFLCADRVALLHDGRLAHLGPTAEVVTPATLRETYGVDVDVVPLARDGRTVRVCVPSLERRPG
jgi:iron complex transport system ATP-binding protein